MLIVDAHLDLAYNVARGRDVRLPAREQPVVDDEIATVGLPDLREGAIGLVCATLFAMPASQRRPRGYRNADEAHAQAMSQLEWYRAREQDESLRIVRDSQDLGDETHQPLRAILLMEGADPIRTPDDVRLFVEAGVRIIGMAWSGTHYAGGTGAPGPLTSEGRTLVPELDRFGIIHDASHLADESFFDLLDLTAGPIMASHSNCRAIVPGDRHLSDEMIRAILARGGLIGVNFYDQFLLPPEQYGKRRATLADVVHHMRHICDLAGDADHVGIGTDLDGGLGREQIPVEIETIADLHRLADALCEGGFNDRDVGQIMGQNWQRFFRQHAPLPAAGPT